jgi:hypothetical protein
MLLTMARLPENHRYLVHSVNRKRGTLDYPLRVRGLGYGVGNGAFFPIRSRMTGKSAVTFLFADRPRVKWETKHLPAGLQRTRLEVQLLDRGSC